MLIILSWRPKEGAMAPPKYAPGTNVPVPYKIVPVPYKKRRTVPVPLQKKRTVLLSKN